MSCRKGTLLSILWIVSGSMSPFTAKAASHEHNVKTEAPPAAETATGVVTSIKAEINSRDSCPGARAGDPWESLLRILEELRIPHTREDLSMAAVNAMLSSVDRYARLVSHTEGEVLRMRQAGLAQPAAPPEEWDALPGQEQTAKILALETFCWPRDIVYIKVNGLFEDAGELFAEAVTGTDKAGLIIDMRNAGGLDFDAVDKIAAFFTTENETLYAIKTMDGKKTLRESKAVADSRRLSAPTILLTNTRTTQAAELLTAILREAPGVMLLGDRTRGDPRLRELHRWSDDYYLYLPTSVIHPAQHSGYEMVGVVPHLTIRTDAHADPPPFEETRPANDEKPSDEFPDFSDRDPVLARAVDILIALKTIQNGA